MKRFPLLILLALLFPGCSESSNGSEDAHELISETDTVLTFGDSIAMAPYLFRDNQGDVYLTWTEKNDHSSTLNFSKYEKERWSAPGVIATGTDWFVNWADYPVIVTTNGQNLLAHHLQKSAAGTYDYSIELSASKDAGKTWSNAGTLHDDGIPAEHGFVSMTPYKNNFFVTWLDGRNTGGHENTHSSSGAMTLRAAIINPAGIKLEEWEVDNMVCDCCQTSSAITTDGPVVVYRNRTAEEIRDIYITRLVDSSWTEPVPVFKDDWEINGCPVNGPRVIADEQNVAVAWFSGAKGNPSVKVAFSDNNGQSFSKPVNLSKNNPTGRADLIWTSSGMALITWIEDKKITGALVSNKGEIIKRYVFASSDESRNSGFPQLIRHEKGAFLAWTDPSTGTVKLRSFTP